MKQLFCLLLFAASVQAQDLRSGGVLKPEQANMDIRHYTLNLSVDPLTQTIEGFTEVELQLQHKAPVMLLDLWNGMTIRSIEIDHKKASFTHQNDLITLNDAAGFPKGYHSIKINYGGKPAIATRPPWTGGFQWDKDEAGNPWIAVTCQGEGGKIFFPCKDHPSDEPNEGADMILTVPEGLFATAPGLLQKQETKNSKTTFYWKTNYTISNYCLVFNIGKYVAVTREYTSIDGHKIPMVFYVTESHRDKGPHLLEMLERTCHILEKYFGEYPFAREKIGLCETPHLGMEHQTNVAYGNKFRYTQVGGQDFDWLLNHEFGHEWWANKVSNADWAHMWIQEGICSYGDQLYKRELEGEAAHINYMKAVYKTLDSKYPVVRGEQVDSDSAYKGPIYNKGAYFMHSLRHVIGDSVFFPTLKKLATDQKYTYDNMVTTKDVEQLFSNASGKNLQPFFHLMLYTTDRLQISITETGDGSWELKLLNLPMEIPVEVETSAGKKTVVLSDKPIRLQSSSKPVPDPDDYYYKIVIPG